MATIVISKENIKDEWFDGYVWGVIGYPEGLTPADYIEFAHADLAEGRQQRNLINSVSNAKRALHLEVETINQAFGESALMKKMKNFPDRLNFVSKLGLVKTRILNKLNRIRNLVEHEYYVPTESEAEDFVDVVELFIEAMKINHYRYPMEVMLYDAFDDSRKLRAEKINVNFRNGELLLQLRSDDREQKKFTKDISINDEDYFTWTSFILRNNR